MAWTPRNTNIWNTHIFRKRLYFNKHDLFRSGTRTYRRWHLAPLQNHILGDPPVGVHINPFILIAHQELHAVRVGEDDDRVGFDATLDLKKGTEHGEAHRWPRLLPHTGLIRVSCVEALAQVLVINTATGRHCLEPTWCHMYLQVYLWYALHAAHSHLLRPPEYTWTMGSM